MNDETVTKKLMFYFPKCVCDEPIIYHLVKDYQLIVNIYRAKVTPEEEEDEAPVEPDLLLPKVVEPRDDSGGASYSLQSIANSLSAGGRAAAGRPLAGLS